MVTAIAQMALLEGDVWWWFMKWMVGSVEVVAVENAGKRFRTGGLFQ